MTDTTLPQLSPVPNISLPPLVLKATISGITFLKQNSFRVRYTGNKYSAVDINGNLWLRKAELIKEIRGNVKKGWNRPEKKEARVETRAVNYKFVYHNNDVQMYENLLTQSSALLREKEKLSTKEKKSYTVNKKEVRQRILGYINTVRGKKELYFWTVTFPPGITDHVAYKVFNIWLTSLRQRGLLKEYIWIAERQEIGTVHFHIAIPHKMPVQRANAMMKGTLKNMIRKGQLDYSIHKIARYNGVDIAKNRNTKRVTNFAIKKGSRALVTYLTKYITKNDTAFPHLAWHNSRGYSSIFTGITMSVPEFVKHFAGTINKTKKFETDFFVFVPWLNDPPWQIVKHLYDLNSYTQSLLN